MASAALTTREMENLLCSERIIRIAFDADGERYLVPLGYVCLNGAIYCFTSQGKKTRMAGKNPHVSFQIDNAATRNPFEWTSVTGEGEIKIVVDVAESEEVRSLLFNRFHDMPQWAARELAEIGKASSMIWLRIEPKHMTGRKNVPVV